MQNFVFKAIMPDFVECFSDVPQDNVTLTSVCFVLCDLFCDKCNGMSGALAAAETVLMWVVVVVKFKEVSESEI